MTNSVELSRCDAVIAALFNGNFQLTLSNIQPYYISSMLEIGIYLYVCFFCRSFVNAAVAGDDGGNVVAESNANQGEKNTHRVAKAVSLAQS